MTGFRASGLAPGASFPNSSNTGPAPGTTFTAVGTGMTTSGTGWTWQSSDDFVLVSGTDGVTLDSLNIAGWVKIGANNVTLRNCIITGADPGEPTVSIGTTGSAVWDGTTIEDCILTCPDSGARSTLGGVTDAYDIATNILIQRCEMYYVGGGFEGHQGIMRDCYIHDIGIKYNSDGDEHLEGVHCDGPGQPGTSLTIEHNTILLGNAGIGWDQTAAIIANQSFGVVKNLTIANNLLAGGDYSLEAGASTSGSRNDGSCSTTNGASGSGVTGGSSSQALVQDGSGNPRGFDTGATITCTTGGIIPSGTTITGVYNSSGVAVSGSTGTGTQYTLSCLPSAVSTGSSLTFTINPVTSNVVVTGNRISTMFYPDGGTFGPVLRFDNTGIGNLWSGNVWHDGPSAGQIIVHP